jgi:very-short-patch-repair endonuclease
MLTTPFPGRPLLQRLPCLVHARLAQAAKAEALPALPGKEGGMSVDEIRPSDEAGLERINTDCLGVVALARFAMDIAKITESPIETLFGVAVIRRLSERFGSRVWWGHATTLGNAPADAIQVVAQLPWRNFRIDWAILVENKPFVFVECDGQEFHTGVDQEARDRRRDEVIRGDGVEIIRFTGSELHRSDDACGALVANFVANRVRL